MDVSEYPFIRGFAPAYVTENVKLGQEGLPVQEHVEHAAGFAPAVRRVRAKLRLDEEQVKLIITRLQWNIVGELAAPPLFEHCVIGGPGDRLVGLRGYLAPGVITVACPPFSLPVNVIPAGIAGKDTNGVVRFG